FICCLITEKSERSILYATSKTTPDASCRKPRIHLLFYVRLFSRFSYHCLYSWLHFFLFHDSFKRMDTERKSLVWEVDCRRNWNGRSINSDSSGIGSHRISSNRRTFWLLSRQFE